MNTKQALAVKRAQVRADRHNGTQHKRDMVTALGIIDGYAKPVVVGVLDVDGRLRFARVIADALAAARQEGGT